MGPWTGIDDLEIAPVPPTALENAYYHHYTALATAEAALPSLCETRNGTIPSC